MQIFEFFFNPKHKEDYLFDSFIYEPENAYEKKLGNLYLAGDIKNTLPHNSKFLDKIAQVIKKNYYNLSFKTSTKALSESLKKANEFLAEEVKKENVSWMGNMNFIALSIKDFNLSFTKTGDIMILMIRQGQIMDLGKNLNLQDIDPYPLKVFFNIVSGKLMPKDIVIILTKEVFDFFIQQRLLEKIAVAENINKKILKEILPPSLFTQKDKPKISGMCFLAVINHELEDQPSFSQDNNEHIKETFLPEIEKFSLNKIFAPIKEKLINIRFPKFKNPLALLVKFKRAKKPKEEKVKIGKTNIPSLFSSKPSNPSLPTSSGLKSKLIIITVLLILLSTGFLIFKGASTAKQKKTELSINELQEKFDQAEEYLIFKDEARANSLLLEIWTEISDTPENTKTTELKESVKKKLEEINKLETITPELLVELNSEIGFEPQSIIVSNSDIISYNPNSPRIYKFNIQLNNGDTLEANKNLESGSISSNGIAFFSKPNTLIYLKNNNWEENTINTKELNFTLFASYLSNVYFWTGNEIIKYSNLSSPQNWIKTNPPEQKQAKAMAVDESIWILNKDNSIDRYYGGNYQETISFEIFPKLEDIKKIRIKTGVPYIYLLENNRIIITDRNGKIVKQFQSEEFNDLKDIDISTDGKIIYTLNKWKIFKIKI